MRAGTGGIGQRPWFAARVRRGRAFLSNHLASFGSPVQTTRLYDVDTNTCKAKFYHKAAVLDSCFVSTTALISGGLDKSVMMYVRPSRTFLTRRSPSPTHPAVHLATSITCPICVRRLMLVGWLIVCASCVRGCLHSNDLTTSARNTLGTHDNAVKALAFSESTGHNRHNRCRVRAQL